MTKKVSLDDLKEELHFIQKTYPMLKEDAAFIFWFLRARLVHFDEEARTALTGKQGGIGGEKGIDAIYIDDKAKQCNLIQGKFHNSQGFSEKRNDILSFVNLASLPRAAKDTINKFYSNLDSIALQKFKQVVHLVTQKGYTLKLFYVTTGKCSGTIVNEANDYIHNAVSNADFELVDYNQILSILEDYLLEIIPYIPPLKLKIDSAGDIKHEGFLYRFDPKRKIESWVLSIKGQDIGAMYSEIGSRLFAKNIRGWLGSGNDINEAMAATIKKEPHNFWYYNNGVTIVCRETKYEKSKDEEFITIEKAQVINGQQTTRTLSDCDSRETNVLVKIIKLPRSLNENEYDSLVNCIVKATNWQNHIKSSDLVSNDDIQIYLDKELRKKGYQYIRKRMTKSEAKSLLGQCYFQIDKTELAQAIAACIVGPQLVRQGKEHLFEEPNYPTLFGNKNISFYLSKYWLKKKVESICWGFPEWGFAKWLVLHHSWHLLSKDIGEGYSEARFRHICEQNDVPILSPLNHALKFMFKSALHFYKLNRGSGNKAIDVTSFFKSFRLNEFDKFWVSNENPYRKKVEGYLASFRYKLSKVVVVN